MYQVIARKYRPLSFADLVNQKHVRTTLENAIVQNRIAHGYIFAGQRGTGKTTVARIVARCLNCAEGPTIQPCGVCASCQEISSGNAVDVIEIDAASNRGINEIRELRENVRYRPARGRFKVFIVDEAHQITSEAFNALLKTLEEPPEWVVFILCTTEAHKIPSTISSRCQQFSFRAVDFEEIVERMAWICAQEGISADPEVLLVLAQAGEGSVRDSLSALDQAIACCGTTLDATEVRRLLGLFSLQAMSQVTGALAGSDSRKMLEIVDELEATGQNLQHFCRELGRYFRSLLVMKVAGAGTRLVTAIPGERTRLEGIAASFSREDLTRYLQLTLDLFQALQTSTQPRLHLELGLLKLVEVGRLSSIEDILAGFGAPPGNGPAPGAGDGSDKGQTSARTAASKTVAKHPVVAAASTFPDLPPPDRGGSQEPGQEQPANPEPPPPQPLGPADPPADPPPDSGLASPHEDDPASLEASDLDIVGFELPRPLSPGDRIVRALRDLGLLFTADAVRNSAIEEEGILLRFRTPKQFSLAMKEADLRRALTPAGLGDRRIRIEFTAATGAASTESHPAATDQELLDRVKNDPQVQHYQQLFDGQLKDIFDLRR